MANVGKTLIVGVGFFGQKLFSVLEANNVEVEGSIEKPTPGFRLLDIIDKQSVENVFLDVSPKIVVLTAALSNVDYCELHKDEAFKLNVEGTRNIVAACEKISAKLVFISTDYVFDGKKGNYSETDNPSPIQYYGATKLLGEEEVLKLKDSLILRVSSLYGYNSKLDRPCFPLFVINQLKQGKEVNAATQITCPTLIDDVAVALLQLLQMNASGIFHVVGADALSRFDVAQMIADDFELDRGLIKKANDLHLAAARPLDSSLSIKKLNSVGIEMSDFAHGLEKMKKQMEEY
jgi:dTDP-4-dehydrorhamnose reductase